MAPLRRNNIKQAEKEHKAQQEKSPFVRYCMTVTVCILIAAVGFVFIMFSGSDTVTEYPTWNMSGTTTYVTAHISTSKVQELPVDEDKPIIDKPSSPSLPGMSANLSVPAERVRQVLSTNPIYASKADALAFTYNVIQPILGHDAAIGMMANVVAEGNFGVVEYSFSQSHAHGFALPSGSSKVQTRADVEYLLNWTTVTPTGSKKPKIGSCGFGVIQWSGDRRVSLAQNYLRIIKGDLVTENDMIMAEVLQMQSELSPGSSYATSVINGAFTGNNTPAAWAEAFCDYYVRPSGCCGTGKKMSSTGSSCQTRRKCAEELARIIEGGF